MPSTVSTDGAKADFKDGVLNVSFPKREETKARKIEITGGDAQPKTIDTQSKTANA